MSTDDSKRNYDKKLRLQFGSSAIAVISVGSFLVSLFSGIKLLYNSADLIKRAQDIAQNEALGILLLVFCVLNFVFVMFFLIYNNWIPAPKKQLKDQALKSVDLKK